MAGFDNDQPPKLSPRNERSHNMPPGIDLELKLRDITECVHGNDLDLGLGFESSSPSIKSTNSNGAKKKCHLCLRKHYTFFCKDCIEKGNFTHSTAKHYPERFADKKLRFYHLSEQIEDCARRIDNTYKRKMFAKEMRNSINLHNEKAKLLLLAIDDKKLKIRLKEENVKKFNEDLNDLKSRKLKTTERIQKMLRYKSHIEDRIKMKNNSLQEILVSLKEVKRNYVNLLLKYIFPVNKVSKIKSNEEDEPKNFSEVSEAQQLTFLKKHWVVPDCQETEYKILDAILPANWNYSDYSSYSSSMKSHDSPSTESIFNNPANRIIAALTYIAQLVAVLAYFLDVKLPKNVCYSEFCGAAGAETEEQFLVKVAKLNINIIHLCSSQKVDSSVLSPSSTLQNLMYIFNHETSDLGRIGPIEISPDLAEAMTQSFRDLNFSITEKEEDVNLDIEEWETVSNDPSFEPFIVPTNGSTSVTTIVNSQAGQSLARPTQSPQTTSTLGGGLISSLWRAATGQR